jgi:glyoxylase-like metal-dependent hydrolase (beta-lactamase superfamily II)
MSAAMPLAEKAAFIKPGQDVVPGIQAVNAFGHSPGMLAYRMESGNRRLLLWADLTNHFVMSLMKPECHVLFDHDKGAAVSTPERILATVADEQIPAIGYHMPFSRRLGSSSGQTTASGGFPQVPNSIFKEMLIEKT